MIYFIQYKLVPAQVFPNWFSSTGDSQCYSHQNSFFLCWISAPFCYRI